MSFEVICCLGDSIANGYWDERGLGWFGRLQEKIAAHAPGKFGFNNLAQSGDRTIDCYQRLCTETLNRETDVLIIAIGINDLMRWEAPDGEQELGPTARLRAWQKLLKTAKKNIAKVVVVGLIPVVENRFPCEDNGITFWQNNRDVQTYNSEIQSFCEAADVPMLNVLPEWLLQDYVKLFEDDSHPNGEGHDFLANQVFAKLQQLGWV